MTRRPLALALVMALVGIVPAVAATAPAQADAGSAVSITKLVTRTQVAGDGSRQVVDQHAVTLNVSRTRDLRSRQPVTVTWSGAHPTGNVAADVNSPESINQEYPFLLVECRGSDTTAHPLTPDTCWTQTGGQERFVQTPSTAFPAWRVDAAATPAQRTFHVGDPNPLPQGCDPYPDYATRRQSFLSATGTRYVPDGAGCTTDPPESLVVDNTAQPGNTTWGVTRTVLDAAGKPKTEGVGDTKFTVWTRQDNASLGCQQSVDCSLVAVPIMGVSCDVAAAGLPAADQPPADQVARVTKDCESTGSYAPGEQFNGNAPALSVSGRLWWSASNWNNRISVPLSFAPTDNVCELLTSRPNVDLYGSELMTQAMLQWRPTFCLDPARTPFRHVQVGEPLAANLLNERSIEAALVSDPPSGADSGIVNAPVALSGFAISYAVDDAGGRPVHNLRLTPRLVAKLLTMSYPAQNFVKNEYAALSRNPQDISLDPEFQALNPTIKHGVANGVSAATLLSISSDSDVMQALTTYVDDDPEARRFLDGQPDPWGMEINPSYTAQPRQATPPPTLPTASWLQRDTFEPKQYYGSGLNPCLQSSPVPYLPLVAAPTVRLSTITYDMQFAISTSQVNCVQPQAGSDIGLKLVGGGRQSPGSRFVLGLVSLGDAARYDLDTAALQTYVSASATGQFTDGTGRTFANPDSAGLKAAAKLLTSTTPTGPWTLPMGQVLTDPKSATAYPGTMVVYASLPTSGLPAADALAYAALVRWMATTGQRPGTTNGTLPAGYLPLTAANGVGALASYAQQAATAVAAQARPPSTPPTTPAPTTPTTTTTPSGSGSSGSGTGSGSSGALRPAPTSSGATSAPTTTASTTRPTSTAAPSVVRIATVADGVGVAGWLAPAVLGLLCLAALLSGGGAVRDIVRRRRG